MHSDVPIDARTDRLSRLRDMANAADVPEMAKTVVLRTIDRLLEVQRLNPEVLTAPSSILGESFWADSDATLSRLPGLIASRDPDELLSWSRELLSALANAYSSIRDVMSGESFVAHDRARSQLLDEDQRIASLIESERYRAATSRLLSEVEGIADHARGSAGNLADASGKAGNKSLALHFSRYARAELISANVFRGFTILAIAAAVIAAVLLPHPAENDWPELAYRLAVIVGIAGLGTYFGRQAGQHRRVYNWAKSLQVQLQSFPAFMDKVRDDETSAVIYAAFAKRVLGAPPEKAMPQEAESPLNSAQIVELISALAKRNV